MGTEKKIGIIGAGAMGSIYAGLLAASGNEVHIVDIWQNHIDAIKQNGLRITGFSGDRTVLNINAHTDTESVGICDLVIIATKASGVSKAAEAATAVSEMKH